jgi:hypothetical protein
VIIVYDLSFQDETFLWSPGARSKRALLNTGDCHPFDCAQGRLHQTPRNDKTHEPAQPTTNPKPRQLD